MPCCARWKRPNARVNAITAARRGINSRLEIWTDSSCAAADIALSARMTPTILLMGPTASGKSAVALALASRMAVEIVSVDSAQVYRGMDIGTAKPDAATRELVAHHLIDLIDPDQSYSAARFRVDALGAIAAIRSHGRIPLLVGG